jgi:pimeloyl-ACP methyl ester carboxylesterase
MRSDGTAPRDWLALDDGRRLAYAVTGPATGVPVIYCHGAIGTPVGATVELERLTRGLGVRFIAPSRPGVGGSDALDGRSVDAFADDVRQLADALTLERFALVGVSAGGPYALATARALGERVIRTAICSSLAPSWCRRRAPGMGAGARAGLALLEHAPRLCRRAGDALLPALARHPALVIRVIAAHAAPCERALLARPEERAAATHSFLDAATGGVGGMIEDFLTYSREWGFDPAQVSGEVHLWHGVCDPVVAVEHALELAAMLPNCVVFLDADAGHHFFRAALARILGRLLDRETRLTLPRAA